MPRAAYAVAALILAVSLVGARPAEKIGPELAPLLKHLPEEAKVPIIVRLSDKVALSDIKPGTRSQRRRELIRALQEKAATSQFPVRSYLESQGVSGAVSLLLINGVAFEAILSAINFVDGEVNSLADFAS